MRWIKTLFDFQRKHFQQGGRLEKYYPLFEAMETIFFAPAHVTRNGPHTRDSLDVKRFMTFVIVALMPPTLFGIYNAGYQSNLISGQPLDFLHVFPRGLFIVMPLILISYGVGFFWEIVFAVRRKHAISEGLFVSALLFPLTLPPTLPLWQAALGISFGIVIGKEVFGGTGRNFLNPALTGRAFLYFSYPAHMSGQTIWSVAGRATVDAFSGATPLAISTQAEVPDQIHSLLENANYTFIKLFLGRYPGSIGETSTLLCVLGAVILVMVGIANYRIIFGGIFGVLSVGYLLNILASETSMPWFSLNPFYHLVMGGFAFGLVYMATEPVTAPDMDTAKWIYGYAIGALTVFIRVFNPAFPEGIMLAILFMNLFAPLMDHIEVTIRLKKRMLNV